MTRYTTEGPSAGACRYHGGMRLGLTIAVVLLVIASPAAQPAAPIAWESVAAGVEHARIVRQLEPAGRAAINALRIDLSRVRLDVIHALDAAVGLETVSSMAQRRGAIAAVNGGYFRTA